MNLEVWILAALVFLFVVIVSFVALRRVWEPRESPEERAQRPAAAVFPPASSSEYLFEGLTRPLAGLLPSSEKARTTIQQELRAAGYYGHGALTDYLALRNLLVTASLLIAGALCLIFDPADTPAIAVGGLVAAILGFSVPRLLIQFRGRNRAQQIQRALPTGVDLLALALTAGLNLYAAFQRVAIELRFSYPVLAEEFDYVRRQAELRSLEFALEQLADRVRLPEMRNLAIILAQSERLGSDATAVLLEASNNLRITMRQRAETQANRTSLWLLFPTVACFLVAAALIIIGPIFLDFRRQMDLSRLEGQKNLNLIRSIKPPAAVATPAAPPNTEPQ